MKYKEGAIGFVVSIIIAVFLVGIVAYVTLDSIRASVTSIFEPLKKLVGIETKKAEASTINKEGCTIKRYYWSKDKVNILEKVEIIIEGSGNCDGKMVNIQVFKDIPSEFDARYEPINVFFKDMTAKAGWPTHDKGKFYFTIKFGNYLSQESKRLEIV